MASKAKVTVVMAQVRSKKIQVTVPQPFKLLTETRGIEKRERFRAAVAKSEQVAARLRIPKANPLPLTTFDPQVPTKPEPQPPTVAHPFHLEGSERHAAAVAHVQELREAAEKTDISVPFAASPVPLSLAVPQVPSKPAPKPSTVPKEFHLEGVVLHEKELEIWARARAILAKEIGKERDFKAQPIPDYSDAALPPRMPAPVTVPQEMVLETATRVRKAVESEEEAPPKRRAPPPQSPGLRRCAFSIVAEQRCGHEYGLLRGFGEGQPLLILSA